MTPDRFRAALAALKLSQLGTARLFRQNGRTVRRWASGDQDVPAAVSIALRLMEKHGEDPADWIEASAATEEGGHADE